MALADVLCFAGLLISGILLQFSTAQSLPYNPYYPCNSPYLLRLLAGTTRDVSLLLSYLNSLGLPPSCLSSVLPLQRQSFLYPPNFPLPPPLPPYLHLSSEIGKTAEKGLYNKNSLDIPADQFALLMMKPFSQFKFQTTADLAAINKALIDIAGAKADAGLGAAANLGLVVGGGGHDANFDPGLGLNLANLGIDIGVGQGLGI